MFNKVAKPYSGRLAFDGDFHIAEDGKRVVTLDGGKTWVYAGKKDASHFERYHRRYVTVDSTANAELPEPHHYEVHHEDAHRNGLSFHNDVEAPTQTSHTEAWRDE